MEPFEFDGPPLAGRTLPILPFPGSVTVACTGDKRQPETCVPKGQPGVSVQASGEIKVERTPTALDYNGCPLESMSIQSDAEARRQRRGQGREDRRPDPGPRRAGHEVPDHRHAGHGRGHRERPPQAAEPRRPALARPRREHPAQRGLLRRHQGQGHLQGAPGRAGLRRRPARVERRQAHRRQQGARDGRRRGLRQAGAEVRRQVRRRERLARQHQGAQRRQAARGRHRHLDHGRLGRLSAVHRVGPAPEAGLTGHERPDEGRDGHLQGLDRARGQARRDHDRRADELLRGPLDRDAQPRHRRDRAHHAHPLQPDQRRDRGRQGRRATR